MASVNQELDYGGVSLGANFSPVVAEGDLEQGVLGKNDGAFENAKLTQDCRAAEEFAT
jgi:hypothetical protein